MGTSFNKIDRYISSGCFTLSSGSVGRPSPFYTNELHFFDHHGPNLERWPDQIGEYDA